MLQCKPHRGRCKIDALRKNMNERLSRELPLYSIVELPSITYFVRTPTAGNGAIDADTEWTLKVATWVAHDARDAHKHLSEHGRLRDEQYGATQEVGGFLGTCLGMGALHIKTKGDTFRMSVTKEMTGHMNTDSVLDKKSANGVTYTLTTRWSDLHGAVPTYTATQTKTSKNAFGRLQETKQTICNAQGAVATGLILADLAYRRLKYPAGRPEDHT